jgi:glycosyltransferase involved in cell wall biosynthesis
MKSGPSDLWICAQIGAREHYAVPRALHLAGRLGALYTDFYANPVIRKSLQMSSVLSPLALRFHSDLAHAPVRSWNLRSLAWEAGLRLGRQEDGGRYLGYCEVGRRFASAVRKDLKNRKLSLETIFFAYDTGAFEIFEYLQKIGVRCVLDQMDPNRVEVDLVCEEEKLWPGWRLHATMVPEEYFRRREQEWALADCVVVNSEFCRQALVRQGVSAEKLVVIPLCYEPEDREKAQGGREEVSNARPLKILFLGQVILRKGIQYLMEAAKLLRKENIHFDVVGPIGISDKAVKAAPPNMTFHGRAGRKRAEAWYQQSDLFVLPTLSDGFAITQIEAMAHGLPVITTPNCGEIVTDGIDGFIIPVRDAEALAKAFARYVGNPGLLHAQQAAARQKAAQFTLSRLAGNLAMLQNRLRNTVPHS